MERNSFLKLALSAATFIATPMLALSRKSKNYDRSKGFKIKAGEGRFHGHIKLKGVNSNVLDVKISGKDTEGDLAIFEQTSLSQGKGVPLHIHHLQDEIFYAIEGSYFFVVGEEKYHLVAGESIFLPRAIAHAWVQESEKGRMLVTFQPAGKMEEFFVMTASLDHEPSKEEMATLFSANDMSLVGPALKLE